MNTGPQRIGSYPIERELGRGGMGIVYLGRDTRLDRQVAIKVLPEAVARDPERLSRFEREARLLASLNHPNIGGIYGLEESDGHRFLALEYIEGETLAERLARGALPIEEALDVCRQVAAALEAAHESGVIHRDLKPANVKLTPGGDVKVLDFGLAKGGGSADSSPEMTQSPTMTYMPTGAGVILGTAAYMSPEQARGKPVDRRTDIWSFGCLLYEGLTGRQLFTGETVSDMIAKILEREPDWNALPAQTPEKVRELLRRCLEKDSKRRLRDIGDARLELEEMLAARTSSGRVSAADVARAEARAARAAAPAAWLAWGVATAAVALAATAILAPGLFRAAPQRSATRFAVTPPPGVTLNTDAAEVAISPDGRMVAYTAADSVGNQRLWVRSLDALSARVIPGTDNAGVPFWSPDNRFIAFFADGKLRKAAVTGGAVEALCDAKNGRGGSWNRDNVIVFAPEGGGPLYRISASGGEPQQVTALDSTRRETAHRFPWFLPDGKRFMFVALPARAGKFDIWAGSLDSPKRQLVMSAPSSPVFVEPGYMLFPRGRTLVAQEFDSGSLKLTGEPMVLPDIPGISNSNGYRAVTASTGGALAYLNGVVENTKLVWYDRAGREIGTVATTPARYEGVWLSPDQRFAAVSRSDVPLESDLWLIELERSGVATRFTFGPARNANALWSPDGKWIAFESDRSGPFDLYLKPSNAALPETTLFASDVNFKHAYDWTNDGRFIVFEQLDAKTGWDLWVLPADRSGPAFPYLRTPFNERVGFVSPDGRWMGYTSDESGRSEIYVQSFPTPGNKYRVTTAGGFAAWWRGDGRELIFFGSDFQTLWSAPVETSPVFRAGTPRPLFRLPTGAQFPDPSPDFQRILVPVPTGDNAPPSITVVLNWDAELKKR